MTEAQHSSADEMAIRAAFAAFTQGNPQPFFDLLADDVVVEFPASTGLPWAGRLEGKAAVLETMGGISALGEYTEFGLIDVFGRGPRYMVQMVETFRFHATGEAIRLEQIFLYEMRDGQVAQR